MKFNKKQDTSSADVPIMKEDDEAEDIIKTEDTIKTKDTSKAPPGPTLEELIADPLSFRRYVALLADATPPAPPHLHGDDVKKWNYRHLLAATPDHLLLVFKGYKDRKRHAWLFYDAYLKVNTTDYKDSPFQAFESARSFYEHVAREKRFCQKVAAGLPENK